MVEMRARSENALPITDQDEAQRFDLSSRMQRYVLLLSGMYWVFIAALLNVAGRFSLVAAVLFALVGIVYTLVLIRRFAREHRARLSQFTDPMTGELRVPGGRLPLPPRLRRALWVIILVGVAVLLALRR